MDSKLPGIQVGRAIAAISVFYFHSYIGLTYFDKASLHTFDWLAVQGGSGGRFVLRDFWVHRLLCGGTARLHNRLFPVKAVLPHLSIERACHADCGRHLFCQHPDI